MGFKQKQNLTINSRFNEITAGINHNNLDEKKFIQNVKRNSANEKSCADNVPFLINRLTSCPIFSINTNMLGPKKVKL